MLDAAGQARLGDFGIARHHSLMQREAALPRGSGANGHTDILPGTYGYVAPDAAQSGTCTFPGLARPSTWSHLKLPLPSLAVCLRRLLDTSGMATHIARAGTPGCGVPAKCCRAQFCGAVLWSNHALLSSFEYQGSNVTSPHSSNKMCSGSIFIVRSFFTLCRHSRYHSSSASMWGIASFLKSDVAGMQDA